MSKLAPYHERIAAGIARGESVRSIARELGVDHTTVMNYRDRYLHERELHNLGEPAAKVDKVDILEAENRELRARLTASRKVDVAEERILQAVEQALSNVPPVTFYKQVSIPIEPRGAHHRQMLLLSDFHGGEVVDPDAIGGLGEYNWDVMQERVNELLSSVRSHQRRSPELTGLDVLFVGDMCSGANHDELAVTNEYPLAEQGVKMGFLQAQIVRDLAMTVPDLRVLVVPGNHPRLERKPAAKQVHNNMDWVAGIITERAVDDLDHVQVVVPKSASAFWECAGRTFYVWHGDGVKSTMPGVPWGGVIRRTNELAVTHRSHNIDHFVLGHYHQPNVVQGGRIIMNGSLKGVDEWTMKNFGGSAPPCQLLLTFDEKRRRMTDVKYITPTAGLR